MDCRVIMQAYRAKYINCACPNIGRFPLFNMRRSNVIIDNVEELQQWLKGQDPKDPEDPKTARTVILTSHQRGVPPLHLIAFLQSYHENTIYQQGRLNDDRKNGLYNAWYPKNGMSHLL